MKKSFYLIFTLIFTLITHSQTGIGVYSVHDGGFENHSATLAGGSASAANLSTTLWTANTTQNVVRVLNATGGRSGPKFVSLGSANGTLKNFYSPQITGAFAPNTTYQIQFWYKSASTIALEANTVDIFVDNTSATQAPPVGTKQSIDAGLSTNVLTWTKVAVSITTNATIAGNFGVAGFTIDAATGGYSVDIDDFVVYQANSPDTTAPNSPGSIIATGTVGGGANVSWSAASGGVDGGGYMVVRYATNAPSASDDLVQNGIYKFANPVGAGVVRYIGSGTSFTDSGLSPGVDYYYKVYTVDKAFNYSDESVTSNPIQSIATTYYYKGTGLLTDIANWGLNTDGTGAAPANFTDASKVFEIRNTTAVTLDGVWTVGSDPANGTKIRLGNATQAAITLTLNSGASIGPAGTGNLDVSAPTSGNQKVIYKGTTAISFGNIFDNNLEVIYDAVTVSSSSTKSFGTISIINGANVTFSSTPVIKNILVDATSTLVTPTSASSAFITIPSGGSIIVNGTVKVPKLTGFVSSNVGTSNDSFGAIQFLGAENLTLGANSNVEYVRTATGAQTVTARTDYKNLILSGTTPKNINGPTSVSGTFTVNQSLPATSISLIGDVTVNGTLTFLSGKITTGVNTLTIGTSGTIAGAGQSTGWVVGNLKKVTSSNISPTFSYAIGDSNNYTPLVVTFTANTSAVGGLTAKINITDHPQIATSGLDSTKSVNKIWTLTNDSLAGFGTYSAAFTYSNADIDAGSTPANYKIRLYDGSNWLNNTINGIPTDANATATGISTFGDFAIGEVDALGIEDNNFKSVLIYPNPVKNGVLNINSSLDSNINITLFDITGKAVLSSGSINNQIDVKSVRSGVYFAKIRSGKTESVQKIIIEN
ncbi:MAG: T9SS type A sorting domain-containing protein [Flavobacterium sp.]|nr:T9SS type A sorting domain-containing protein [Flavobacterium sp.]